MRTLKQLAVVNQSLYKMLDLNPLLEFSRAHCIAICAVLVPANLITTSTTIALVGLGRSFRPVLIAAGIAALLSGVMVLHVLTWFLIGVVMLPTYILLWLGSVCLITNLWAVFGQESMQRVLRTVVRICTRVDVPAILKFND